MPKSKYDWPLIKKEFMASDYNEVKQYFQDKFKIYNATITMKTKGWTEDKIAMKERATEKAIQKIEDKFGNAVAKGLEEVVYSLMADIPDSEVGDKKRIWEVLRTEAKLPLRYDKFEGTIDGGNGLINLIYNDYRTTIEGGSEDVQATV